MHLYKQSYEYYSLIGKKRFDVRSPKLGIVELYFTSYDCKFIVLRRNIID